MLRIEPRQAHQSCRHNQILRNAVPHVEHELSTRFQHPVGFPERGDAVGKEHHAELAHHGVETLVIERQCQCVRSRNSTPRSSGLVAAWSSIGWFRSVAISWARGNASANAAVTMPVPPLLLPEPSRRHVRQASGDVACIRHHHQRTDIAIVEIGNRANET